MKKLLITEQERKNILKLYGLLVEKDGWDEKGNVYMTSYPGSLLDLCGYRAIEKFEETMGDPNGKSMGDYYFEGGDPNNPNRNEDDYKYKPTDIKKYEDLIISNLSNNGLLETFKKFPNKLKMQIWSWMFNNTDASQGTIKYIAGLGQAINYSTYSSETEGQKYRLKVMKVGSPEYKKAISEIKNYSGNFDELYNNYLLVLDQQYKSTAENNKAQGSYDNSWKYRPTNLTTYYNECSSETKVEDSKDEVSDVEVEQEIKPISIKTEKLIELSQKIKELTVDKTIDLDSIKIDLDNHEFSVNEGVGDKVFKLLLVFNKSEDEKNNIFPSKENVLEKNKEYSAKVVKEGKFKEGQRSYALIVLYPKK